jgi:hypothetical protein
MAGAIPGMAWVIPAVTLLCSGALYASAPSLPEIPLQKSRGQWTVEGRVFNLSDDEFISLYGIRRRRFFTAHWYWGEAGAGALTGQRGGYFEGGGTLGFQHALFGACTAEAHVFSGAGGGGGVQEGGGWMIRPTVGLGMAWSSGFNTTAEAGYARFVNGNIRGWTVGIAFNYSFWEIQ